MDVKNGIPSEEEIVQAVRSVMTRKQRIESQRELFSLVKKELESVLGAKVRVSADRIRRIALSSRSAKVEIEYRETSKTSLPDICPVCGNAMSPVMNMNLDGNVTEVKRNCTVCAFSVANHIRVPGRYVFVRVAPKEIPDDELRIRKLRKAASHLRAAKRLIGEALEGTDFPDRKRFAEESIDTVLSSKEEAGSIPSLEADIRDIGHDDPLWTQPLGSPKYPNRKVI
ncbi:hypothetical protein TALC_00257 [Thermoplasmatales archaeon BRNA1]|nr:hypothetical protein TALC_00257 [Thermoplasmatales archaeon BRNA1]